MKKIFVFIIAFAFMLSFSLNGQAGAAEIQKGKIIEIISIQKRINNIGLKLLNANKIDKRMIFVYDPKIKKINFEPGLRKRQIIVYKNYIQFADNDDEIAAFLARETVKTYHSYLGGKGWVSSAQVKLAPKKFEIYFDKRAVDFMVNAGFNPLGLITFINKSYPQKRSDRFGRTNLTSKRLANIYEYIYTKYPYFLKYNTYLNNEAYQNFLLTSENNRKKLYEKIKSNSKKAVKYE